MDKILTLNKEERATMRCESEIRDKFKERLEHRLHLHCKLIFCENLIFLP